MEQWNKGYGSSKYSRDQEFEVAGRPLVWVACGLPLIRGRPVAMKGSRRRSSISPPLAFYSLRGCFTVDLCKNLFRNIQALSPLLGPRTQLHIVQVDVQLPEPLAQLLQAALELAITTSAKRSGCFGGCAWEGPIFENRPWGPRPNLLS